MNPTKQFVLIYRKLYGINNFIGLQQADRFELQGDKLKEYLDNPKSGKEILMRGLGNKGIAKGNRIKKANTSVSDLFPFIESSSSISINSNIFTPHGNTQQQIPKINIVPNDDFEFIEFDMIILGLGFEERALGTVQDILTKKCVIKKALCIKYNVSGQSEAILAILNQAGIECQIESYNDFVQNDFTEIENQNVLCCVSGLSKELIFRIIHGLSVKNRLIFSYTSAKEYYPLGSDIKQYLNKYGDSEVDFEILDNMKLELVNGEKGPYRITPLYDSTADESKKRVLIAFSSPKYERLYKIFDEREYDIIELITPTPINDRKKLASNASELLSIRFSNVTITELETDDLTELLQTLYEKYDYYYIQNNCNVEISLTGSKQETIISSILSVLLKISKYWYVNPSDWDTERFSKGIGETAYFEVINTKMSNDLMD